MCNYNKTKQFTLRMYDTGDFEDLQQSNKQNKEQYVIYI